MPKKKYHFTANPQYYDYMHFLILDTDQDIDQDCTGTIQMLDGGGQVINFEGHGEFQLTWNTKKDSGVLKVYNLKSHDPYATFKKDASPPKDLPEFTAPFTVETGEYVIPDWKPYVKYGTRRYRFRFDPLYLCTPDRVGNLMFDLEGDKEEDTRLYYLNMECGITRKDLQARGIVTNE